MRKKEQNESTLFAYRLCYACRATALVIYGIELLARQKLLPRHVLGPLPG